MTMSNFPGEDLNDPLKRVSMAAAAGALDPQKISYEKLFDDGFLLEHTDFATWKDFLAEAGYSAEPEQLEQIPIAELDEFVARRTTYHDWQELLESAQKACASKHEE